MNIVNAYKAEPIGEQEIPSVTIVIDKQVPDFGSLANHGTAFDDQAVMIADALRSLPGGVQDRLLAELLERQASWLRVSLAWCEGP